MGAASIPIPKTDDELWELTYQHAGIKIPRVKVCSDHEAPFTAFADAYFARVDNSVWLASRGFGGKSVLLATLSYMEAITYGASVSLLGGSAEQSRRVHDYMTGADTNLPDTFWAHPNAPTDLLKNDPTQYKTRLTNGGVISVLTASAKSIRGPHPNRLRCLAGDSMVLTPLGEKQIKDISAGDMVISNMGGVYAPAVVEYSRLVGVKPTIILELSNGKTLQCTEDHRVLTDDGKWIYAEDVLQEVRRRVALPKPRERRVYGPLYSLLSREEIEKRGALCGLWSKIRFCYIQVKKWGKKKAKAMYGLLSRACKNAGKGLYRLRKASNLLCQAMQGMSQQEDCERCLSLCRLRGTNINWVYSVPPMSFEVDEQKGRCQICEGESKGIIKGKKQDRACLRRFVKLVWRYVQMPGSNLSIHSGLFDRGYGCSNRGTRRILAQQGKGDEEGREKKKATGGKGLQGYRIETKGHSPLVHGIDESVRVVSARRGPVVPVYDLTIRGSDNFISDGVVVHNCDEVDELEFELLQAALPQHMSTRGIKKQGVFSSTRQYAGGTMDELIKMTNEKESFRLYTWCYRETQEAWLEESEVESKRSEVTQVTWETEYEHEKPSGEDRAIMTEKVTLMFPPILGEVSGKPNHLYVFEKPSEGARYGIGVDWARKKDWTIIEVLRCDCDPMRVVAFHRTGRLPWPVMVGNFETLYEKYNLIDSETGKLLSVCNGLHDGTGLGDVIDGYLTVSVPGFIMVGRKRSDLLSEYISAVEREEIVSPLIQFMHGEHLYATIDQVYGSDHLPDSVAAGALAYRAATLPADGGISL